MDYDLIVIGGGVGGYTAALRASNEGFKTALIESRPHLGGTCLNVGCIPSKALLSSSELYATVRDQGASHGLKVGRLSPNIQALLMRKDAVVERLREGLGSYVGGKVHVLEGLGTLSGSGKVLFQPTKNAKKELTATHILLASGSTPASLPCLPFDGKWVVSSDEALQFPKVPRKLVVVGGGAIGLELGSLWSRLGSQVSILEAMDRVAMGFDKDVSAAAAAVFVRQGLELELSAKVQGFKKIGSAGVLRYERFGDDFEVEATKVLVAVGRRPNLESLVSPKLSLALDKQGFVLVNERFATNLEHVYALGDLIGGPMLAHKGEEEGHLFVETLLGRRPYYSSHLIPNVIYTHPELACVGMSEDAARSKGIPLAVGKAYFKTNGRALAAGTVEGFVKIVAERSTDKLLGCQIFGPSASELVAIVSAHLEYGGASEDIARTIFAHPTLSEVVRDAARAAFAKATL